MNSLPHGLSHICLLNGEGGLRPLPADRLEEWSPEAGNLWLHFNLTDPDAKKWLEGHPEFESIVVNSLLEVESRPRLTVVGKGALLAFRGVNLNKGATPDDMIGIRVWLEENRVITSFRRQLRSIDDLVESLQAGEGPKSAADVIVEFADRLVGRMGETVDNLEDLIAELEEQLIEGEGSSRDLRLNLAGLRRQIIALRRYLAPQREALTALINCKFGWIQERHRMALRESSDRLIRHLEDLDAVRERAAVTQEELANRLAEQQNMRMYVLSIVAAIFLPLGFLTGLLGINVGGIPGSDNPAAFAIFAGMLVLIVFLEFLFFRSRKWF